MKNPSVTAVLQQKSKAHTSAGRILVRATHVLLHNGKEASVSAGLFAVLRARQAYFSDTVAVVWVGVPFTVSTIGTAVPAGTLAGICRLNCCTASGSPGALPA